MKEVYHGPALEESNEALLGLHNQFKEWVGHLDWRELLCAMEFVYGSSGGSCEEDEADDEEELRLLYEMLKEQTPVTNPIHPRALQFSLASDKGPVDGRRNEYERVLRERYARPKLFQWIETKEEDKYDPKPTIPMRRKHKPQNAGRSSSQTTKVRPQQQQPAVQLGVRARNKITADGERLSLGCTQEQREADATLLSGTILVVVPTSTSNCGAKKSSTTFARFGACSRKTARDILRMLHVVSRGQFLKTPFSSSHTLLSNDGNRKVLKTAPWFKPTTDIPWLHGLDPTIGLKTGRRRWFSLSMYLASRFELALWTSFCDGRRRTSLIQLSTCFPADHDTQKSMLPGVIARVVAETLKSRVLSSSTSKQVSQLRDSSLWNLLELSNWKSLPFPWQREARTPAMGASLSRRDILDGIWSCPLVEVDTPMDQFRSWVREHWLMHLAKEVEKKALEDLLSAEERSNGPAISRQKSSATETPSSTRSNKSRNKKKAKRKKKKGCANPTMEPTSTPETQESNEREGANYDEGHESSSEEDERNTPYNSMAIAYPANGTSSRDRNRNIVFALSILEDVVKDVFVQVGLPGSESVQAPGEDAVYRGSGQGVWEETDRSKKKAAVVVAKPVQRQQKSLTQNHKNGVGADKSGAPHVNGQAPKAGSQKKKKPPPLPRASSSSKVQHTKISDRASQVIFPETIPRIPQPCAFPATVPKTSLTTVVPDTPPPRYPDYGRLFPGGRGKGPEKTLPVLQTPANKEWPPLKREVDEHEQAKVAMPGKTDDLVQGRWSSAKANHDDPQWTYTGDPFNSAHDTSTQGTLKIEQTAIETPLTDHRTSVNFFTSQYGMLAGGFVHRSEPDDFAWGLTDSALDDWGRVQGFGNRDTSILAEFFHSQDRSDSSKAEILASSTAASIASSEGKLGSGTPEAADKDENFEADEEGENVGTAPSSDYVGPKSVAITECSEGVEIIAETRGSDQDDAPPDITIGDLAIRESTSVTDNDFDSRSVSPHAPSTPSPTLSPILVSLADLKGMRRGRTSPPEPPALTTARSFSSATVTSLPNSPNRSSPAALRIASSLSRENLDIPKKVSPRLPEFFPSGRTAAFAGTRTTKSRDDHDIKSKTNTRRSTDALSTYRNPTKRVAKSRDDHDIRQVRAAGLRAAGAFSSYRGSGARQAFKSSSSVKTAASESGMKPLCHLHLDPSAIDKTGDNRELCARSEIAIDGHDDYPPGQDSKRCNANEDADNITVTKDGSTTITSAVTQREPEETANLREERNTYRDLCLTLGAEVAKLKNMLAAQAGAAVYPPLETSQGFAQPFIGPFDLPAANQFSQLAPRAQTLAAMSDAGYRGEHESLASEEETAKLLKPEGTRHMSSSVTAVGSDISVDHNSYQALAFPGGIPLTRHVPENGSLNGLQSRLARDILQFLDSINAQLWKQDTRRKAAVERVTRLVNTVWPRAQVKLYGSHVTGLCLPTSDVDFIICLPAVHKNAPAVAPGALEGRNAINETSQKLLYRKLKGESWLDPRSMKLIERTVVPVIKVATKDTRARTIQLDITFDGPGHQGLAAVHLVTKTMEELPMIRPLVLVLKQFLLDRGLLTAYTGGLSSYCLFLMVTRYLQEQSPSWGDCGSLLMGFLDYYGNHFDPRLTGISVGRRQYFARVENHVGGSAPIMWTPPLPHVAPTANAPPVGGIRRNSFSDKGSTGARPPRFQAALPPDRRYLSAEVPAYQAPQGHHNGPTSIENGMPYTFDPLFVEDPLSAGNNVGRNAFRIFQVQRVFSDAHRALVAALEWDMHSADMQDNTEYTLLKCLLQNEDVVFEL